MPSVATVTITELLQLPAAGPGVSDVSGTPDRDTTVVIATIAVDVTGGTVNPSELGLTSFNLGSHVQRSTGVTVGATTTTLGAITAAAFTVGDETATYSLIAFGPSLRKTTNS